MTREEMLERLRAPFEALSDEQALAGARAAVCALRERLADADLAQLRIAFEADLPELFTCADVTHTHKPAERRGERLTEPELAERVRIAAELPNVGEARLLVRALWAVIGTRLGGDELGLVEGPANEAGDVGELGDPPRRRRG